MLDRALPASGWLRARLLPIRTAVGLGLGLGLVARAPATWGNELLTHAGDYTIENWQVEQGLPQISVTSIAQTPDGYLWVGTFSGLARFDGVRFKVFTEGNTPALGNNGITGLQVDAQGALWIVTMAGGLVRMAGGQFAMVQKEEAQLVLGGDGISNQPGEHLLLFDRHGSWHRIIKGEVLPLGRLAEHVGPRFMFLNTCASWIPTGQSHPVLPADFSGVHR